MKVLIINGSSKADGNTGIAINGHISSGKTDALKRDIQ